MVLAVSSDGRRIAAAGAESLLKIWDSGKPVTPPLGDPQVAAKLAKLDTQITFTKSLISRSDNDLKSYKGLIPIAGVHKDAIKMAEDELAKVQKTRDEKQAALAKVRTRNRKKPKSKLPKRPSRLPRLR